ncbi:ArsB/NhaD family transporter [bacterium]|nr:ArsB/NhaD family transporter [bacterium]
MNFQVITTIAVFVVVYLIISFELINKAYIALLGAGLFLVLKIIPVDTAFSKVDLKVISILISTMIIVNILKKTGVFQYLAIKSSKMVKGDPIKILILLMVITAVISAFLPNVTTIMILGPVSILIAVELGISPVPFLILLAVASNIGGTATLIGDPPNIMIAYGANLTFNAFIFNLSPLILVIMVGSVGITYVLFKKVLVVPFERRARIMEFDETKTITDKPFLIKSLVVLGLVIAGFLFYNVINLDPAIVAVFGATVLMVITKNKPDEIFGEVEWTTIFFFVGLFIMVGTLEELGVINYLAHGMTKLSGGNIKTAAITIVWGSGILSGFIDNIPFVATMIPLIKDLNLHIDPSVGNVLWWSLSAGACLGGNLTLVGASANVISAGIAQKNGYTITFMDFTKYGVIYTVISLIVTTIYIYVRYLL